MKTLFKAPLAVALAVALTGCVTTQEGNFSHVYTKDGKCLTCINNPITGEPLNHDGPGIAPLGSEEHKAEVAAKKAGFDKAVDEQGGASTIVQKLIFTVPKPVDVAYLRIKREFNYYDLNQVKTEHGDMAWRVLRDPNFAYEAMPSTFYKMRDFLPHNSYIMADGSVLHNIDGLSTSDKQRVSASHKMRLTVDTELMKESSKATSVTLRYWLPDGTSSHNTERIGKELQARVFNAIAQ